jgi:hypothetical protein
MVTHAQIQDWYEQWFGGRKDANSQNAISALHALLGTDQPRLEDKLTTGSLKKTIEGDA